MIETTAHKRGLSRNQIKEINFPINDYTFPTQTGSFIGELVMKKWNDSQALICYFVTDKGEKFKICVWQKHDEKKSYMPKHSNIDFSYVNINTQWNITYGLSKTNKTVWLTADEVEV